MPASFTSHTAPDPVGAGARARATLKAIYESTPLPEQTFGAIVAGLIAQRTRPALLPGWLRPVGWVVAGLGLAVVTTARMEREPGSLDHPAELLTDGAHGRTRNPIYVGFHLFHLGLAAATRNGWMLATFPVSAALVHREVLHEERWLHERFGEDFDAYRARVPRYL